MHDGEEEARLRSSREPAAVQFKMFGEGSLSDDFLRRKLPSETLPYPIVNCAEARRNQD